MTNVPDDLAVAIIKILETALLNVRCAASAGDAERCWAEANHVHNLPSLLMSYSPDLMKFYWTVERKEYLGKVNGDAAASFREPWKILEGVIGDGLAHAKTPPSDKE